MTQRGGKALDCGNPPRLCFVSAEEALSFATEVRQRASLKQLGLPWSWKWRKWAVHKLYIYKYVCIYVYIYIFTHICIHLYIYSLIHFLFICFFLCFFWFWLIYFFKRAHQERKQERGACTNMYIYISTYHIYIYGFYVGQICIYIFYIHWLLYMYMWLLSLSLYICIYIYIGTYTPQSHHTSKSQPLAADLSNHPFKWNSITNSTKKNIPSVKSFWGNVLSNPT